MLSCLWKTCELLLRVICNDCGFISILEGSSQVIILEFLYLDDNSFQIVQADTHLLGCVCDDSSVTLTYVSRSLVAYSDFSFG